MYTDLFFKHFEKKADLNFTDIFLGEGGAEALNSKAQDVGENFGSGLLSSIRDKGTDILNTEVTDPIDLIGSSKPEIPAIKLKHALVGAPLAAAFGLPFLAGSGYSLGRTVGSIPGAAVSTAGRGLKGLLSLLTKRK